VRLGCLPPSVSLFPKMAAAAAPPSSAKLGLDCPVCLSLFDEPTTLSCGHSLCNGCLARLTVARPYELKPAVTSMQHPGTAFAYLSTVSPAIMGSRYVARCPSCRTEGPTDGLRVSVQLRASIGALFPALVGARDAVKRLTSAAGAARAAEVVQRGKLAPATAERRAADAAFKAAEARRARAAAAEAREAERDARLTAKSAAAAKDLAAAQAALAKLEKEQPRAGEKRKR